MKTYRAKSDLYLNHGSHSEKGLELITRRNQITMSGEGAYIDESFWEEIIFVDIWEMKRAGSYTL